LTGIQPQIALATWASSRWHLKKTYIPGFKQQSENSDEAKAVADVEDDENDDDGDAEGHNMVELIEAASNSVGVGVATLCERGTVPTAA